VQHHSFETNFKLMLSSVVRCCQVWSDVVNCGQMLSSVVRYGHDKPQ